VSLVLIFENKACLHWRSYFCQNSGTGQIILHVLVTLGDATQYRIGLISRHIDQGKQGLADKL